MRDTIIERGEAILLLSKNIKYLRTKNGLSQLELAEILGITDKAVSTWETAKYEPRIGMLEKISKYFGVPKSVLLDLDMEQNEQYIEKPPADKSEELTKEEIEHILLYRNASPEIKAAMRTVLESADKARIALDSSEEGK